MEFVGIRVIKAELDLFNRKRIPNSFRLKKVHMFRDGQWAGCIECPECVFSNECMRIFCRLRAFANSYFLTVYRNRIYIHFQ